MHHCNLDKVKNEADQFPLLVVMRANTHEGLLVG